MLAAELPLGAAGGRGQMEGVQSSSSLCGVREQERQTIETATANASKAEGLVIHHVSWEGSLLFGFKDSGAA